MYIHIYIYHLSFYYICELYFLCLCPSWIWKIESNALFLGAYNLYRNFYHNCYAPLVAKPARLMLEHCEYQDRSPCFWTASPVHPHVCFAHVFFD